MNVHILYCVAEFECDNVLALVQIDDCGIAPAPVVPLVCTAMREDTYACNLTIDSQHTCRTLVLGVDRTIAIGVTPVDGMQARCCYFNRNGDDDVFATRDLAIHGVCLHLLIIAERLAHI